MEILTELKQIKAVAACRVEDVPENGGACVLVEGE